MEDREVVRVLKARMRWHGVLASETSTVIYQSLTTLIHHPLLTL
jgi:hypothetical protein